MVEHLAKLHRHVGESFAGLGKGVPRHIFFSLAVKNVADLSWADMSA